MTMIQDEHVAARIAPPLADLIEQDRAAKVPA
jgi:hypothetical protein